MFDKSKQISTEWISPDPNYRYVDQNGFILKVTGDPTIDDAVPTALHRNFVRFYLENGGNTTNAMIRAGSNSKNPTSNGWEILQKPWVVHAIAVGRARLAAKAPLTPDEIMEGLRDTVLEARSNGKYDAAIKGYNLLGTQLGMFVQKTESVVTKVNGDEQMEKLIELRKMLEAPLAIPKVIDVIDVEDDQQ